MLYVPHTVYPTAKSRYQNHWSIEWSCKGTSWSRNWHSTKRSSPHVLKLLLHRQASPTFPHPNRSISAPMFICYKIDQIDARTKHTTLHPQTRYLYKKKKCHSHSPSSYSNPLQTNPPPNTNTLPNMHNLLQPNRTVTPPNLIPQRQHSKLHLVSLSHHLLNIAILSFLILLTPKPLIISLSYKWCSNQSKKCSYYPTYFY